MTKQEQQQLEAVIEQVRKFREDRTPGQLVIHFNAEGQPVKAVPSPVLQLPGEGVLARGG